MLKRYEFTKLKALELNDNEDDLRNANNAARNVNYSNLGASSRREQYG